MACKGHNKLNKKAFLEFLGRSKYQNSSAIVTLQERVKINTQIALEKNNGNLFKTASQLKISVSSLQRKLNYQESALSPSFEANFSSSPARKFFEKIQNTWNIISFDTATKEVCVEIKGPVKTYVSSSITAFS